MLLLLLLLLLLTLLLLLLLLLEARCYVYEGLEHREDANLQI